MPKGVYLHKPHTPEQKNKISLALKGIRQGKKLDEIHGIEKANQIRERMRLAKLGKKRNFVPRFCIRGENHYKWIQDRDKIKLRDRRDNPEYKRWRMNVWIRDNFKCRIANDNCSGRIEAHHILGWSKFPELRYVTNNGITLCHFHHPRKRVEEERLIPVLTSLVLSN